MPTRRWAFRFATMNDPQVVRVLIDFRANQLTFELDGRLPRSGPTEATIDVGTRGRLIGIELASTGQYLAIADPLPQDATQVRSTRIMVTVSHDGRRLHLSRQGETWDIGFPSGNQCWTRRNGQGSLCSVVTDTG